LSAALLKDRLGGNYFSRLCRGVMIYLISFSLVAVGYTTETVWDSISDVGRFASGWSRIPWLLETRAWTSQVPIVLFIASIVTFVILLQPRQARLSSTAFRALFVVLALTDILQGMMRGFTVYEYVNCVIFDFFGSLLFAAIIPIFASRLVPTKHVIAV